jgi:hypothetical protein
MKITINIYYVISIVVISLLIIDIYKRLNKRKVNKAYVNTASKIIDHKYPQDQRPNLYRQMYDILEEPSRLFFSERTPINIRTRGTLPPYQQVGFVYRPETDPDYNPDGDNMFPLYGRPEYRGSSIWEYYVDAGVKINLSNNKELQTNDVVSIKGFAGDWISDIYAYKEFRYIPYIF